MKQRIQINTHHLSDLWRLPVIKNAYKGEDDKTYLVAVFGYNQVRMTDGDALVFDPDTKKWHAELTTSSLAFNGRYPETTGIKKHNV